MFPQILVLPSMRSRNLYPSVPLIERNLKEQPEMNSIVWLVGAVVIVIAVLNLIGLS